MQLKVDNTARPRQTMCVSVSIGTSVSTFVLVSHCAHFHVGKSLFTFKVLIKS